MAKKMASMPKMGSKSKADKKDKDVKTTKVKPPEPEPLPPAASVEPAPRKAHTRKMKPSEEDALAKGRRLAAAYLVRRDGMDEETASMVVEGMSPSDINELIFEANTATIAQVNAKHALEAAEAAVKAVADSGAKLLADDEAPAPDFLTIPELAGSEEFAPLVLEAADAAKRKNDAEKQYKAAKARLIVLMKGASTLRVEAFEYKLSIYTGHSVRISEQKLADKGVSADVIVACRVDTPFDDVRITAPKVAREGV